MIDEIKILQEIVGDLSGLGVWLVAAYLAYKVLFLAAVAFSLKFIVIAVLDYLKADITRADAKKMMDSTADVCAQVTRERAEHSAAITLKNAEINEIKSLYKILKESDRATDS